ncbi:MAG: hypothetical protein QOG10_2786 [Kribbellaceae bacterium]|jgi:uncharacterized protein (UPF0548 family)|nr:hypothetical protein [Kribbellaceae bacterium]
MKLQDLAERRFSYDVVGSTTRPELTPPGYHRLEHRARIGAGDEVFLKAAAVLMSWQMHSAAGVRIEADTPRAEIGTNSLGWLGVSGIGMPVPCRVVWTVDEPNRIGFGYGTLQGHPESGEESFIVCRENDEIWFTVLAYSRPAAWYTRLVGPVGRLGQQFFANRYAAALRRLAT